MKVGEYVKLSLTSKKRIGIIGKVEAGAYLVVWHDAKEAMWFSKINQAYLRPLDIFEYVELILGDYVQKHLVRLQKK